MDMFIASRRDPPLGMLTSLTHTTHTSTRRHRATPKSQLILRSRAAAALAVHALAEGGLALQWGDATAVHVAGTRLHGNASAARYIARTSRPALLGACLRDAAEVKSHILIN